MDWNGAMILVEQGGRVLAQLEEPPYEVHLDVSKGRTVALWVIGLLKNLLGTWHYPERSRGWAWIRCSTGLRRGIAWVSYTARAS